MWKQMSMACSSKTLLTSTGSGQILPEGRGLLTPIQYCGDMEEFKDIYTSVFSNILNTC